MKRMFNRDFRKLLMVCLKMLFRKSTRIRFVCLVVTFLIMIGFNTCGYVTKFHTTEAQKKMILGEKAFKVFLLRMRSPSNAARFLSRHEQPLNDLGARIAHHAFIYQNNLYIHFIPTLADGYEAHGAENASLMLLYDLFDIRRFVAAFHVPDDTDGFTTGIRCQYLDYNGGRLPEDIVENKHATIRFDLIDISDMIRESLHGKRFDVYNHLRQTVLTHVQRVSMGADFEPNAYFSRVETIIPMNLLHLLTHIAADNTTDVLDMSESVRRKDASILSVDTAYLGVPERYQHAAMYGDLDIYPRYIPLCMMDVLALRWHWLLYQDIRIESEFMDYIDQLHFQGHYLFSYEKANILKDRVKKINADIHANHVNFYLTDLSMGIAFPFMISLFAFIYLKTEIAFLLMFKNKIKEVLFIFWFIPVGLMFLIKFGALTVYMMFLVFKNTGMTLQIGLPLSVTFVAASAAFYPINRWCFSQFTGSRLNLYQLHKGR